MTLQSDDIKSWLVSFSLHAALLLFMFFWIAFPEISIPEVIEITFLRPEPRMSIDARAKMPRQATVPRNVSARPTVNERSSPRSQPAARQAPSRQTTARRSGAEQAAPSTSAHVPPRDLRSAPNPVEVSDFGGGRQIESSSRQVGDYTRTESRETGLASTRYSGDNAAGGVDGKETQITSDPGIISNTPSSAANIRWNGEPARNRIAGALPKFPPGERREVQVSVRFQVRPNGSLFGMMIIQRGDPRYERAALTAMRSWKFNALPSTVKQADQVGTVTFTFKLK